MNGYNDYIYTYGATPAYGYTQNPYWTGGRMRAIGVYVDDTIRVGRLTLNAGVRYDYQQGLLQCVPAARPQRAARSARRKKVDKLFDWNVISPRIGATVKVNEAGNDADQGQLGHATTAASSRASSTPATPSIAPRYVFDGRLRQPRESDWR